MLILQGHPFYFLFIRSSYPQNRDLELSNCANLHVKGTKEQRGTTVQQ